MKLFDLQSTEQGSVELFQEIGVLPKTLHCPNGHEMKLYFTSDPPKWRCNLCSCRSQARLRVGNWFEGSRIPFVTAIRFVYCWSWEMTSIKFCERELGMSAHTTVDWSAYLREVCVNHMSLKPEKTIGGEGLIVEIDESVFTKRKNNMGRVLPQVWVFGGICRESNECFLVEVSDRSAKTLQAVVKERVKPGSTIMSDCWRAYKTNELEAAGFTHLTVNHTYNFVDPDTGANTQKVERMWGAAKWRNKKHRLTARHHLESYLAEFMCRQEVKAAESDLLDWTLEKIMKYWPPEEQMK